MSFQVLVKTAPVMTGSYSYLLRDRAAAELFVQRPDVWWWCFPVEEDALDSASWRKGGAWEIAAMQSGITGDLSAFRVKVSPEDEPGRGQPGYGNQSTRTAPAPYDGAEEEGDERW